MNIKSSRLGGRGVFADQSYKPSELIEVCPIILLSKNDRRIIDKTLLYNYYYSWDKSQAAIALGKGSLYNHSYHPNAKYRKMFGKQKIEIVAIKTINSGDEITINYGGTPSSQKKLWFDVID